VVADALSCYLLARALRFFPFGVLYAMWSGLGIVCIAIIGYAVFGQRLDLPAVLGLGLIISGIVVIQLFSKTAMH